MWSAAGWGSLPLDCWRSSNPRKQAAEAFLQELKDSRADAAYQQTTADYRRRVSREELETLTQKHQARIRRCMAFRPDVFAPDTGPVYSYSDTIPDAGGFYDVSVTVVKEGEAWKVDRFSVEQKAGFP